MSASWVQALRAFAARAGPPSTLASRQRLYDLVAQTHLTVRRGERVRASGDLAVLREARWMLLRDGTTGEKAQLLEHIMKTLAEASGVLTYEASAPVGRDAPQQRGRDASGSRAGSSGGSSLASSSSSSSARPQHTSLRHQLLLEQVQCLVEAKVSEIPLTARHYRYPLRSPLLAEVSPELPLLLLDDLAQHPRRAAATPADWEAQVDCCASLAGAGHTREALALCGDDGRVLRAALPRLSRQHRDGWRRAWALAAAVPAERITAGSGGAAYSEDWLRGVLEAAQLRSRATIGGSDESEAAFAWVDELRRRIEQQARESAAAGSTPLSSQQRYALRRAQRLVGETYLALCPPSHWREAVGVVLARKATAAETQSPASGDHDGSAADAVSAGRVMALLLHAEQPWMVLLFFYGDPLALYSAAAPEQSQRHKTTSATRAASAWTAEDAEVQRVVDALLAKAKKSDRLAVAAGTLLRDRDVQHAAVYNYAMAALAATGHRDEAVDFYHAIPVACVNAYTHWGVLQLFLQPNSSRTVAAALASTRNYEHCRLAARRLVRTMPDADAATAGDGAEDGEKAESFTRDQANVWESMALWAALRGDTESVLLCAAHAPPSCRYVQLIALITAANERELATVGSLVRRIAAAPRTTRKELCLAAAVLVVYFPVVRNGGSNTVCAANPPSRSAVPAELAGVHDDVARALGSSLGRQQAHLNEAVQVLVDFVGSLQRRRRSANTTTLAEEEMQSALADVLVKAKVLNSTMDLVRLRRRECEGDDDDDDAATAVWRSTAQLIQQVGTQQGLSVARAAPALVSAGVSADVAIDLLPS